MGWKVEIVNRLEHITGQLTQVLFGQSALACRVADLEQAQQKAQERMGDQLIQMAMVHRDGLTEAVAHRAQGRLEETSKGPPDPNPIVDGLDKEWPPQGHDEMAV